MILLRNDQVQKDNVKITLLVNCSNKLMHLVEYYRVDKTNQPHYTYFQASSYEPPKHAKCLRTVMFCMFTKTIILRHRLIVLVFFEKKLNSTVIVSSKLTFYSIIYQDISSTLHETNNIFIVLIIKCNRIRQKKIFLDIFNSPTNNI